MFVVIDAAETKMLGEFAVFVAVVPVPCAAA
jgi:hypothetical protein